MKEEGGRDEGGIRNQGLKRRIKRER